MKRWRRFLVIGVITLIIVSAVAYVALGAVIYNVISTTNAQCSGNPEAQANSPAAYTLNQPALSAEAKAAYEMPAYEEVTFPSRGDGLSLNAWYIPAVENPETAPAVILVHGLAGCKRSTQILFAAGMLHNAGFTTLLIDMRDHGDSQVEDGRFAGGTDEYRDVLGAWDWLVNEKQMPPEKIGLLGTSLGAATVLIAFGEEPQVAAVWEDSSYADIDVAISAELTRYNLPTFFAPSARMMGNIIAGDDIGSKSPLLAIATAGDRPVFITHGTADRRLSVQYAADLLAGAQAAGATNVQSWIVEGSGHVNAMFDQAEEYERRLIAFFQMALGG
jgi:uncharacterized protein